MEDNNRDVVPVVTPKTSTERVKYGDDPDVTFFFPNNGGFLVMTEKHRLARISEIFRKQLPPTNVENETGERIVITDISFEIFSSVIKFIYGDGIDIYEDNYLELLYMGKKYFVIHLIHKLVNFILDFINAENLPDHFEFIDKFDIPTLNDHMKRICATQPLQIITRLTKSMPHKKILQIILESPCLPCTDFEIYKAIVKIFSENLGNDIFDVSKHMRDELGKHIFLIRFPTMTTKEIIECANYPSFLTDEQIKDFLLWIEEKKFSNTLQFFSSQPRLECSCQDKE